MSLKGAVQELDVLQKDHELLSQQKSVSTGFFNFFSPTAMPKMGEKEFSAAYRCWVYACTNAIAEHLADIELKFQEKEKTGWQDYQGDHETLDLLHKDNNFMSFSELVYIYAAFQDALPHPTYDLSTPSNSISHKGWFVDSTGPGLSFPLLLKL